MTAVALLITHTLVHLHPVKSAAALISRGPLSMSVRAHCLLGKPLFWRTWSFVRDQWPVSLMPVYASKGRITVFWLHCPRRSPGNQSAWLKLKCQALPSLEEQGGDAVEGGEWISHGSSWAIWKAQLWWMLLIVMTSTTGRRMVSMQHAEYAVVVVVVFNGRTSFCYLPLRLLLSLWFRNSETRILLFSYFHHPAH